MSPGVWKVAFLATRPQGPGPERAGNQAADEARAAAGRLRRTARATASL